MLERAGSPAPDDYINLIIKEYGEHPTWGACAVDLKNGGDGNIARYSDQPPTKEEIQNLRDSAGIEKTAIAYWFMKSDRPIHEDDLQPFVLVRDDNAEPLLVAFISGKLDKYQFDYDAYPVTGDNADVGRTTQFFYISEYLENEVSKLLSSVDEDISKLDGLLKKQEVELALRRSFSGNKASILFIIADDLRSCKFITTEDNFREYDWGYTSNNLGWGLPKDNIPNKPVTGGLRAKMAAASDSLADKKTCTGLGGKSPPAKDTKLKYTPETHPDMFYRPSPEIAKKLSDRELRKLYEKNSEEGVPNDYKDLPYVRRKKVTDKGVIKDFKELKNIKTIASTEPVQPPKSGVPPVLTETQLKWLHEDFAPKYFDSSNQQIRPPYTASSLETKYKTLSDSLPEIGYIRLLAMPIEAREALIKENPIAALNWMSEISAKSFKAEIELNNLKATLVKTDKIESKASSA